MIGQPRYKGLLKQISQSADSLSDQIYPLLPDKTIVIGRAPSECDIFLDSKYYEDVSRKHVQLRPVMSSLSEMPVWEICDLKSSNGTYINGKRLQDCHILQVGDRLTLGNKGVEFIFEIEKVEETEIPTGFAGNQHSHSTLSLSEVFPVMSKGLELRQQGFLVPGTITVLFVAAMLATRDIENKSIFFCVLAAYLVAAGHYCVHKLCHKHKPWWLLVGSTLASGLALWVYLDYYETHKKISAMILGGFFGPSLFEELFKALPVLLVYWLGRRLRSPRRERIGVWEPLDGILIATASATGFALVETMHLVFEESAHKGDFAALTLLIPRILGDISGQLAYSGYFGYFIGLSALKPRKRWRLLAIGFLTSGFIHALSDFVVMLQEKHLLNEIISNLLLAVIGSLAYLCLMAVILKAKKLAPNH